MMTSPKEKGHQQIFDYEILFIKGGGLVDKSNRSLPFVNQKYPMTNSVKVIKEGAFGGTNFRGIYSSVNGKWYRKGWKESDRLKDIDQKYYCSSYYDASVNKYGV